MNLFKRICLSLSVIAVCAIASNGSKASTWISAEGFYSLYNMAARGDVQGLINSDLPIDGVNRDGDTGLCYSVRRRNATAFNAYLDAGADPNAECTKRVLGYAEFVKRTRTTIVAVPLISGTALAIGAGAAAIGATAIALAAGGGGGGHKCKGFKGDDGKCYDKLDCVHGTQYRDTCQCEEGWTGELCDTPATCPYDTTGCGTGYHETGNTCKSGDIIYKECAEDECEGYQDDPCDASQGWHQVDTCPSGEAIKYKCEPDACTGYDQTDPCGEGYEQDSCMSGGVEKYKCTPSDCSDYPYTDGCPTGYDEDGTCKSGETTKYKCKEHDCGAGYQEDVCDATQGWHQVDMCMSGTTPMYKCEPNVCPSNYQDTVCDTSKGWHQADTCMSGGNTKYLCEADACTGYDQTEHCGAGYEEDNCWSGGVEKYKCTPSDCSDYPYSGSCPEGYDPAGSCQSGTTTKYKCEPHDCGSDYQETTCDATQGWHQVDMCMSGTTPMYKCEPNVCPSTYQDTPCDTSKGWHQADTCMSGGNTKYLCEADACIGYDQTEHCGAGYEEDNCWSGGVEKYKCTPSDCSDYPYDSCAEGYVEDGSCQTGTSTKYKCKAATCTGYDYTECPTGYHSTDQCKSGETWKYKCAKDAADCVHGTWNATTEKCVCTGYWTGDLCDECESGQIEGNTCYRKLNCNHGVQVKNTCECDFGWKNTSSSSYCNKQMEYNNINSEAGAAVTGASYSESGGVSTVTKNNTSDAHVSALEWISSGDKAGTTSTLYNGYYEVDGSNPDSGHSWILNITNSGTGNTFGMNNSNGSDVCHLHVEGKEAGSVAQSYAAEINVSASGAGGNAYGISAVGDVTAIECENCAATASATSKINVTSSGKDKTVYGIYSAASVNHNIWGSSSSSSTITVNQTNSSSTTGEVFGIKASSGVINDGIINVSNASSVADYGIYNGSGDVINNGNITSKTYGVYNTNGDVYNDGNIYAAIGIDAGAGKAESGGEIEAVYTGIDAQIAENTGNITVTGGATSSHKEIVGMVGNRLENTTTISVELTDSATTDNRSVYGLKGTGSNPEVINSGSINVGISDETNGAASGYGIYINGGTATNTENGYIKVTSISSVGGGLTRTVYGIYADGGSVTNKGTIEMGATTSGGEYATMYGIYLANGATVTNSGKIIIQDASDPNSVCEGSECLNKASPGYSGSYFIYPQSGSGLFGAPIAGGLSISGNGHLLLASGGSIEAPSIEGDVGVASSVVSEGFDDVYTLSDAIISNDTSGLNISSQSAMFDASLNGSDVTLTKKAFSDIVENKSAAAFLEKNYALSNNEKFYNTLKSQENTKALNGAVKDLMGDGLKRFAFEDMTMFRELSFDMNEAMFKNKEESFTLTGNTSPISYEKNLGSRSRWMISGKNEGKFSYGVGVAFTDIRSEDSNKENSRDDEMFQMMMPMGYKTHGIEFMVTPRLGYAYGTYERDGYKGESYDGKIEKKLYGVTNEARYPINVKGWTISPTAEFNALGYRLKGHEEEKAYALNIKKQNVFSAEAGFGLNVSKEFKPSKNESFKLSSSIMAYHEFLDPYELELSMRGMEGSWKVRDEKRRSERLAIRNSFEYSIQLKAVLDLWQPLLLYRQRIQDES